MRCNLPTWNLLTWPADCRAHQNVCLLTPRGCSLTCVPGGLARKSGSCRLSRMSPPKWRGPVPELHWELS